MLKCSKGQIAAIGYDAVIGAFSNGADYDDIQDAINDSKNNVLVTGDFTQPVPIITGSSFVQITVEERLTFTGDNNFTVGTGGVRIRGSVIEVKMSGSTTDFFVGTGTLDLGDVTIFNTSTLANTRLSNMSSWTKHLVHGCNFVLPNNSTVSGFRDPGDGSQFVDCRVIGGGTSSNGFVTGARDTIISGISVTGTISPQTFISTQSSGAACVISNITSTTISNDIVITITAQNAQIANLYGNILLNLAGCDNCNFVNCDVKTLAFSASPTDWNFFCNMKVTGISPISIADSYNFFVNCSFNSSVTLTAASSNNQFLMCAPVTGIIDNGTNNSQIDDLNNLIAKTLSSTGDLNITAGADLKLKTNAATGKIELLDELDAVVFKYDNSTNIFTFSDTVAIDIGNVLKVNTINTYNSINGVTIEGVQLNSNNITAGQVTVDNIVLNGTTITMTSSSDNYVIDCGRVSPGDGNDYIVNGADGINAGAGADGGNIILSTGLGVAGGVAGEIYLQMAGVTKVSITDDYISSTGYMLQEGIFAEIYVADASTSQSIPTGATYTKSTAFTTDGQSSNCTAAAASDKITITKTGKYKVSGSFSGISGTANVVFRGAAFLNGAEQSQVHFKRKFATATDSGDMGFTGFIDVTTAPWDLDFRVRHDNGGSIDLTLEYANLNVEYVGST